MPLDRATNVPNSSLSYSYVTIDKNVTALGSSASTPNRGTTSARPNSGNIGDFYFNTDINELQLYSQNGWVSAATAPNAPTNVTVTSAPVAYGGQPGAVVSWTPATTGIPASSYVVTSSTGGFTQTVTTNTATFIGLTAGTSYTFTVTAKNDYGSNSTTSGSITPATSPQQVTGVTAVAGSGQATVSFTAGGTGGATPTYYVYSNPGNIVGSGVSSPVTVTGLTIGSSYNFTVIATNSAGSSPVSASSNTITAAVVTTSGAVLNLDAAVGNSYGGQNLIWYSEDFTQTGSWTKANTTITSNATTSPTGTSNASKFIGSNGASGRQSIYQSATATTSGQQYEVSIYVKAAERRYVTLWIDSPALVEGGYFGASAVFDLVNGVYPSTNSLICTSQQYATSVGNGWYKLSVIGTFNASSNCVLSLSIGDPNNNTYPYTNTGDGTSGVYIWGGSCRQTTYPPGYIKTSGAASVTNNGSTWTDLSSTGLNGTLNYSPTYSYTSGSSGSQGLGYITFNGSNQYASFSNSTAVQFLGTSPYTLESWCYITSNPTSNTYPGIFNHEDTSVGGVRDGYNMYFLTTDQVNLIFNSERFVSGTDYTNFYYFSIGTLVGHWNHYVATYDPVAQKTSLYVNGNLCSQSTAIGNITNNVVTLTLSLIHI